MKVYMAPTEALRDMAEGLALYYKNGTSEFYVTLLTDSVIRYAQTGYAIGEGDGDDTLNSFTEAGHSKPTPSMFAMMVNTIDDFVSGYVDTHLPSNVVDAHMVTCQITFHCLIFEVVHKATQPLKIQYDPTTLRMTIRNYIIELSGKAWSFQLRSTLRELVTIAVPITDELIVLESLSNEMSVKGDDVRRLDEISDRTGDLYERWQKAKTLYK